MLPWSTLKTRGRNVFIHQSQEGQSGGLLWAPVHQSISVKEEIQRITLYSGPSHSPIFWILITRPFTPLTLCRLTEHQQAPALCLHQHPLQGKRMGTLLVDCQSHYAPQPPPPQHPTVPSSTIPSINKGERGVEGLLSISPLMCHTLLQICFLTCVTEST